MAKLGKIGITVGNKTGGSPAATVSQLKSYLKELQNGFDELKRAAEPAANQVSRLSDSMSRINESASNIVKFSEDLSKKLQDVRAKSNSKLNPDSTVFSSFSDLIDLVVSSVDSNKLVAFQNTVKPLRTFTMSLTDIISFSKNYGKLVDFMNGLKSDKGQQMKNDLLEFIKGFDVNMDNGSEFSNGFRTLDKFTGVLKKYATLIPSLNKIHDLNTKDWNKTKGKLFQFIKGFNINLSNDSDLSKGFSTLDKFGRVLKKYASLIVTLGDLKDIDTKDWNKTKGKLFQFIKGFNVNLNNDSDLSKGFSTLDKFSRVLKKYASLIVSLGELKDIDTKDWNKTKGKLFQFIKGFNVNLSNDSELSNGFRILTKFENVLKKYVSLIANLGELKDIDTKDWTKTKGKLFQFIKGFNVNLTNDSDLSKGFRTLDKFGTILKKYLSIVNTLSELKDIDTKDWNKTKGKLFQFIKGFNVNLGNGSDLSNGLKILDKFGNVVKKYLTVVASLNELKDTDTKDWNKTKGKLFQFIKGFNINLSNGSDLSEGYKTFDKFGRILTRYTGVVQELNDLKETDTKDWNKTKGKLFEFIKGFSINLSNGSDLAEGYKTFDKFGRALTKYTSVVQELNTLKEVDTKDWNKVKGKVFQFIKGFNVNLGNGSDLSEGYKTFDKFGRVLKKYNDVVVSLNDLKEVDTKDWNKVKGKVFQFIKGFNINLSNSSALSEGIKTFDDIGTYLKRYKDAISSLNDLKEVDLKDWNKVKGKVFQFIKGFSINLKNKSPLTSGIKVFDMIGLALKRYANAVAKLNELGANSADFKTNLANVSVEIENFITKMALLAKLPAFPDFERVANAVGKFNIKLQDMRKEIEHSSRAMTRFHSFMRQIYTAFVGGATIYSIVRTIKNAVKEMFNLEYAMARVNTIARVSSAELKNMTHFVQEVSATYGVASSKVTKALYDINSATIKGSASLRILEQSVKLAVAGFTDVEKVSDLIAKAVNAYEYSASEAAKISDILFVTVERGINPMEELSEYFGRLFTVSANAGVSLEEVGAGLATLTARGYQTNVASTALNSAILKLSTGTKELNKLFQQYGYASSASALRTIGLSGALQILNKATNGATEKLHDLGFNYRDIRAATTLASGAISEYNKTLALMTDKNYTANKTAEALAKVQDTVKYKVEQLKETYTTFVQSIAEYLDKNKEIKDFLDILKDSFESATKAMRGFNLTLTEQLGAGFVNLIPKLIATYGVFRLLNPILLKSGNLFRGFFLVHKLAPNATLTLRGIFIGLKGIASALKGVLGSLGTAMKWLVVVQGSIEVISRLVNTIKGGNFWSGFMDLTGFDALFKGDISGYFKTMYANYKGLQGSLIDAFTGFSTDFGSQWRNEVKQANVVDEEALRKDKQYQALMSVWQANSNKIPVEELKHVLSQFAANNDISEVILNSILKNVDKIDISKTVRDAISGLRRLDLSDINGASLIQEEYDKWMDKIHNMASAAGFSSEELQELTKRLTNERDVLLGLNKEFTDLQPNFKALNDVFELSRKELEQNYDKNAGPLQKASKVMTDVQNAMNVLSEGFNVSVEQIAVWFNNPTNFAEFDSIIHGGIKDFGERINSVLANVIEKEDFELKDTFSIGDMIESGEMDDIIKSIEGYVDDRTRDAVKYLWEAGLAKEYDKPFALRIGEKKAETVKNHFSSIINTLQSSGLFDEESIKKLKGSEVLFKEFKNQYEKIKENPMILIKLIENTVSNITPEMRSAIQTVATGIAEANKESVNFIKQMVSFSSTVNSLASKFKIDDIITNKLGISEVDFFKKQILRAFGISEDTGNIDWLISGIAEDMRNKTPVDVIKENWLNQVQKITGLDAIGAEKILDTVFDPIIAMAKAYDDFSKQYNKLDYLKHLNKLNYGGEMSAFNKYKDIGSKMISDLKATIISTKDGDKAFETLYNEFNSKLFGGMDFDKVVEEFSTNYGDDAFKEFINKFKEFDGYVKEFVTEINELDFMKFVNRLKFGNELSAFKQFKEVDSKKIADIMGRRLAKGTDAIFKDIFDYAVQYGNEETEKMLIEKYPDRGKEIYTQYANTLKEYEDTMKGSPFALQTQYKGIKKQLRDFIRNYEDAFLSPLQQFNKTEDKLKRQLAKVRKQAKEGIVDPDAVSELIKTAENLQKLNEETMNLKVPAAITASEAVRTGSKEAFDLVARNVFKDTYKVNVRQANYQKEIVTVIKEMRDKIKTSEQIAVTYP